MSANINSSNHSTYPILVSIILIASAVVLSFVDLMFLNDVIGKILDVGSTESMLIAFALGMVGIGVMAHQGVKVAHGTANVWGSIGHYVLWVLLGITFVVVRFFSASILQLEESAGDESLLTILGLSVREVDIVVAPLMMFLYLATGVLVKDGVKHLMMNPDFKKWQDNRKESKEQRKAHEFERLKNAELRMQEAQEKAEKAKQDRMREMKEAQDKAKSEAESSSIKAALNGSYGNAVAQYNIKLKEIKDKHQQISANIEFIKEIDKQENQFESKVKPSLLKIIQGSIESTQNSVALAIRAKTGEDIVALCDEIDIYNSKRKSDA